MVTQLPILVKQNIGHGRVLVSQRSETLPDGSALDLYSITPAGVLPEGYVNIHRYSHAMYCFGNLWIHGFSLFLAVWERGLNNVS